MTHHRSLGHTLGIVAAALGAAVVVALHAAAPNDPLYPLQWHLKNTGQNGGTAGEDVNIEPVWDTYQGSFNEVIAIVDDGLEIGHEDLAPNVVPGLSHNYSSGSTDPTPSPSSSNNHGTAVAGVAAARGSNGIGVSGAAPLAGLAGFSYLAGPQTLANEADALTRSGQTVDIYSNSWGPADGGQSLDPLPATTRNALAAGVTNGRNGRGSIYVWAAGNGGANDNSNYDGYANSRYVIAVAASTNTGAPSSYSEEGANILVNAPSSGGTLGITTTDRTGSAGYNPNTLPNPSSDSNYTSIFGGTSSATPLVSGIVALMLQTNPSLGWRDVRAILAYTAARNNPTHADWTQNGAGLWVNHRLGFGRVNAKAAIAKARAWTNLGPEQTAQASASPNQPIPDAPAGGGLGPAVTSSVSIGAAFNVEFAEVLFSSTDHTYWADLQIELISPAGTRSVLARPHNAGSGTLVQRYDNWLFGTVRHLGESAQGTWTLSVRDGGPIDIGTFQQWTLRLYGSSFTSSGGAPNLTVTVTGSGTVTSSPPGIRCGADCVESFVEGTTVTLAPSPSPGHAFAGWGGAADCLDGRVTIGATGVSCTATFTAVGTAQAARFADLNGDRIGDAFFYNDTTGLWSMAFATGTGRFNFVNAAWSPGFTIVPGYFNTDAIVDLFLYNPITGEWFQALSDRAGGFSYTGGMFSPGWQVFAGRLNGDGLDDLFVYNPQTGVAVFCFVNGAGGFASFRVIQWSPGWDVKLMALDGDAFTDVFVYNRTTGQFVRCLNDGAGSFTYTVGLWSPDWIMTVADLNGDLLDDLFLYNESTGQWVQCLNTGRDFRYTSRFWSAGWRILAGRMNGDAYDDIFVYNQVTGQWFQCFSDGRGDFGRYVGGLWSPGWVVSLTDLDGDGIVDALLYDAVSGQYFQAIVPAAGDFARYVGGVTAAGYTVVAQR